MTWIASTSSSGNVDSRIVPQRPPVAEQIAEDYRVIHAATGNRKWHSILSCGTFCLMSWYFITLWTNSLCADRNWFEGEGIAYDKLAGVR